MVPSLSKAITYWTRGITITATLLLFVLLFDVRTERIANTTFPFFSVEFAGLLVLAGLGAWATLWQAFKQPAWPAFTSNPSRALTVIIGGFILLAVSGVLFAPFVPYRLPFVAWWLLIACALSVVLIGDKIVRFARLPLWRELWQVALSLLVLAFVLEFVLRLWFSAFGSQQDKINYLYSQEQILALSRFEGLPYVNFGLSPTHPEHTANGLRATGLPPVTADNRFVIAAVGGSTTYGISLPMQEAYPAQLQKILHERGYTHVEVLNAGVPMYATTDNLVHMALRLLDMQPDLIITYEGINDVVTRLVDPAQYDGLNRMRGIWQPAILNTSPSVLLRFMSVNLRLTPPASNLDSILANVSAVERCVDAVFCANLGLTPQEVLEANPPVYFRRNLHSMIALAKAHGIEVVLSSWAYYPEPMGDSLFMTYPHVQYGVAQHNAITQELAETLDVPFYDLYATMPYGEQYWLDGFHMSTLGTYEQAVRYADFLIAEGLISAP
ncbi:MAG: GDSL-type esterase/lipase family protein [Anaerolinea sp.]